MIETGGNMFLLNGMHIDILSELEFELIEQSHGLSYGFMERPYSMGKNGCVCSNNWNNVMESRVF